MDEKIVKAALDEVRLHHGAFNGEIIETISVGIGKLEECYCIFEGTADKKIIHTNLTEGQAKLLFEEIKKRIY